MKFTAKSGAGTHEVTVTRQDGRYVVDVDGTRHVADADKLEADFYSILLDGRSYEVSVARDGDSYSVRHGAAEVRVGLTDPGRAAREAAREHDGPERIVTQMPGKVVRVLVEEGAAVEAGQGIVVVEAMKMENEITATKAGRIAAILVKPGQSVEGGTELAVIE